MPNDGGVVVAMNFSKEYPFSSNFLSLNAGRLHYLDEGSKDAPVLLMVHGNPTWSFYYRKLINKFRATHRVIAVDHIGCGLSDKPQDFEYTLENHINHVEKLVEQLQLKDITLVVHDWGGAIGMGYAVRHPENVSQFVVFNTAAFPSKRIPFSINICRIPGFGALAIRGLNAFARAALIRAAKKKDHLTPAVRAGYLNPYNSWTNRVAHLRFVQDIPMSQSHRSYGALKQVADGLSQFQDKPMLIVWGAHDFCFNDEFLDEWKSRFPAATVHYVEDAGHYVVEDAPEQIISWMETFFDGRAN